MKITVFFKFIKSLISSVFHPIDEIFNRLSSIKKIGIALPIAHRNFLPFLDFPSGLALTLNRHRAGWRPILLAKPD
jgi:hypothetical protein